MAIYQQLTKHLRALQFDARDITCLVEKWTHTKTLNRFDFLKRAGKKEPYLYFIGQGTLRIFYAEEHKEIGVGFGYPDTFICDYITFIRQSPSVYYIQALSKAKLIGIHSQDFMNLVAQSISLTKSWQRLTEDALLGRIEREIDLFTSSPKERVNRLLARSPHIFQHIPHKYIASYLRMSPETLSRNLKC